MAFTLIEAVVGFSLATIMLVLVLKFSGQIRTNVVKGGVDLQNLQEARFALNYLRRDFTGATPLYDPTDPPDALANVRGKPIVFSNQLSTTYKSRPIVISDNEIHFYKYENAKLEAISYAFNKTTKTLDRGSLQGTKSFDNIEDIKFSLYYHKLNPNVPLVWVELTIRHKEGGETRTLQLSTSLASSIITRDINALNWNKVY